MAWFQAVGVLVFFIALIASIIIYANLRKLYYLMYIISLSIYVFMVSYVIEAFQLGRDTVMLILAASAIIMLGLGYYLKKRE
ncbi:hypothetical protein HY640_03575 [Candidatus Woesearchaeota archaeon]|nr:hypothetical protein [Candidatus Woesearchaeota archaeon]